MPTASSPSTSTYFIFDLGGFTKASTRRFKILNDMVKASSPTPEVTEVVNGLYALGPTQGENFVVAGWNAQTNERMMYRDVVARACRTCRVTNAVPGIALQRPYASNRRLAAARGEMVACVRAIAFLQNMPEEFVNAFWRDFYRAMLTGTVRKVLMKGVLGVALCLSVAVTPALAESKLNLVVAIDLSRSLQVRGPDRKTAHEQNVVAVSIMLSTLPAGSRVRIIGITDRSFAQPYVLLSA